MTTGWVWSCRRIAAHPCGRARGASAGGDSRPALGSPDRLRTYCARYPVTGVRYDAFKLRQVVDAQELDFGCCCPAQVPPHGIPGAVCSRTARYMNIIPVIQNNRIVAEKTLVIVQSLRQELAQIPEPVTGIPGKQLWMPSIAGWPSRFAASGTRHGQRQTDGQLSSPSLSPRLSASSD